MAEVERQLGSSAKCRGQNGLRPDPRFLVQQISIKHSYLMLALKNFSFTHSKLYKRLLLKPMLGAGHMNMNEIEHWAFEPRDCLIRDDNT